jgi:hypothetical protein
MNDETKKLIAKLYMNKAYSENLVDWAVSCLENGIDSKNIRILASMQKGFSFYEVEDYFHRSLKDLGWQYPSKEEALIWYLKNLAKKILSGEVDAIEGCHKIYNIAYSLDYPSELKNWIYLDDGLEPEAYKTFIDYDDWEEVDEEGWNAAIILEAKQLLEIQALTQRDYDLSAKSNSIKTENNENSSGFIEKLWRKIF